MTEVQSPQSQESAFHGQSIPLVQAKPAHQALFPYFLVFLGTLLVVGGAAYWWVNSPARAEREAQRLDFALKQQASAHAAEMAAIQNAATATAARIKQEAEAEIENERRTRQKAEHAQLVELVESGQKQLDAFIAAQRERDELLASSGREIAARDELLTKYEIIERQHPAPVFETAAVRTLLETVEERSRELAAQPSVAAGPSQELKQSVDTAIAETNAALKSQLASNQALGALAAEASADGVPPADVDIKEALGLRLQRALQDRQKALAEAEERGRQEAERRIRELAEVEAGKRTEIEVDAAAADFNRQQETIRRLHEQQLAAKKAEDEEELRRVTAELQNQIAKLREAADLAEAEVKVTEAAADAKKSEKELEAERIAAETEKNRLREKAKSRDVAIALAPFINKGYWQPGRAQPGRDAAGMSLTAIQAQGALDPSPRGMRELYHLGANPSNDRQGTWAKEDRLVGKPLEAWLKNKPGARDTARKAQDLLIELGDILVEVGLLSP